MTQVQSRRSGGRAARQALRAAPLADNIRPVRPGMSGGRYNPLTEEDMAHIHEAALVALEEIGLSEAPPSGVKWMESVGAIHGPDGRMRFPRAVVQDALDKAAAIKDKPAIIIAHTVKGKGVSFMEGKSEWHGKPISDQETEAALAELSEEGR